MGRVRVMDDDDDGSLYACGYDASTGPNVGDIFGFLRDQNEYHAGCRF